MLAARTGCSIWISAWTTLAQVATSDSIQTMTMSRLQSSVFPLLLSCMSFNLCSGISRCKPRLYHSVTGCNTFRRSFKSTEIKLQVNTCFSSPMDYVPICGFCGLVSNIFCSPLGCNWHCNHISQGVKMRNNKQCRLLCISNDVRKTNLSCLWCNFSNRLELT